MITKQNFFYILSYPRCRSTWFSQFLSTNVSHCYHEMLSGNEENAFFKHMFAIQRPFIGSADTNALSFARARRRTGPMVLIYRPEYDVIKSMLRAFDPHPAFSLEEWDQYIKNTTERFRCPGINAVLEKLLKHEFQKNIKSKEGAAADADKPRR